MVGALIQGFKRAAVSNEAGVGSASIAHSAVRTKEPVTEGVVALLEPFIDTVVICTMTAVVIVISGQLTIDASTGNYITEGGRIVTATGASGVGLTSAAFESAISWFPYVLAVAVVLFAFSTMISWSYYGLKAWTFLLAKAKKTGIVFKVIFACSSLSAPRPIFVRVIDFRCGDLRDGGGQHHRPVLPDADRQARAA